MNLFNLNGNSVSFKSIFILQMKTTKLRRIKQFAKDLNDSKL